MLVRPFSVLVAILSIFASGSSHSDAKPKHPIDPYSIPGHQVSLVEQDVRDLGLYLEAVNQENLRVYLEAVRAAQDEEQQRTVTYVQNNGAHSDAWWRGVAICEQGGLNDSFFGYFSIMDGSAGGLDWSTQVAMANAIIARSGDGAWAASCQAAGYASSPSG